MSVPAGARGATGLRLVCSRKSVENVFRDIFSGGLPALIKASRLKLPDLFYIAFEMALIQGQLVKLVIAFLLAAILRKPVSACSVAASSESNTRFAK